MRILVTGSSGQLGAAVCSLLCRKHSVRGVDLLPGKFTTHIGNIIDRNFIYSATKNVEFVIHTSSLHAPQLETHSKEEFIETNIVGTLNLLQASIENGVQRFVYSSTTSLYGEALVPKERAVWVTEDLFPEPRDIYDVTKIAAENLCKIFTQKYGLPCISLRISRFFPESEYLMTVYRLYRGVDVRDAANSHLLALEKGKNGYEVFNISAASPFSRDETYDLFHDAPSILLHHFPNVDNLFAKRGWKLPKNIDRVYSIAKAKKILDYRPKFNFDTFYKKMLEKESNRRF